MATRKGHPLSAATKAKISAALKGKKRPKTAKQLAAAHRPKTAKQLAAARASLAKARAAQKGKPKTAKQLAAAKANLAKARAAQKGKPKTAKQIAAAKANLGKARLVSAAKRRGKPLSAATRAKISASLLRRHGRTTPLHPRKRGSAARGSGGHRHRVRFGRRGFISAHTHRRLVGLVHTTTRHHRHRPVLRRRARARRVWRKRRR